MISALKNIIFFKRKTKEKHRNSLGKTSKSYGAHRVEQTLKKKVNQKTGEILDV